MINSSCGWAVASSFDVFSGLFKLLNSALPITATSMGILRLTIFGMLALLTPPSMPNLHASCCVFMAE